MTLRTDEIASEVRSDGSPRILLVRPTALGDVSRTVPCLVSLRQHYPDAKIDWLVSKAFADVVAHHPALDDVILFDRQRTAKFGRSLKATREAFKLVTTLRRNNYDMVFDLQGLLRSGVFSYVTRARKRVGFANAREGAKWLYTHRYHVDDGQHTVDRMMQLLVADGIASAADEPDMRLYLSDDDQAGLEKFLSFHELKPGGYACLAPTAQWGCKCWPIEFFSEVAARLLKGTEQSQPFKKIVLLAAKHERHHVAQMYALLQQRGFSEADLSDRVLFPITHVGQLASLISATGLLICNDSAALHIAVGFDRPFIAIHGPTDPQLVGPYRNRAWVVQPPGIQEHEMLQYRRQKNDDALIRRITVESVWDTALQALASRSHNAHGD